MAKNHKKFSKEKHLKAIYENLPNDQKKAFMDGFNEQPNLKIGVQKSLQLGFNDLPIFGGIEEKQTKLF